MSSLFELKFGTSEDKWSTAGAEATRRDESSGLERGSYSEECWKVSRGRGVSVELGLIAGMSDRCADWLSEGRCGGKLLTAARLAELLPLCCCGSHRREGHSSVDYTYYVAYNAECRICH